MGFRWKAVIRSKACKAFFCPVGALRCQMSTTEGSPLSERISAAFAKLSAISAELNSASDDLGRLVGPIDDALRRLNLGVAHWYTYKSIQSVEGRYRHHLLGYAKVGSKWGLALSQTEGSFEDGALYRDEEWLFNDAPRWMRIEAIDQVPELLDQLARKAKESQDSLVEKLEKAREMTTALQVASKQRGGK